MTAPSGRWRTSYGLAAGQTEDALEDFFLQLCSKPGIPAELSRTTRDLIGLLGEHRRLTRQLFEAYDQVVWASEPLPSSGAVVLPFRRRA